MSSSSVSPHGQTHWVAVGTTRDGKTDGCQTLSNVMTESPPGLRSKAASSTICLHCLALKLITVMASCDWRGQDDAEFKLFILQVIIIGLNSVEVKLPTEW